MESLILLCGFLGAWLVFMGCIYQAALELTAEDLEMERIREAKSNIPEPKPISSYWWFLPPVKIYLEYRRSKKYRKQFIRFLSAEDTEMLLMFLNKSTSWLMVAGGGIFIAIKETYELCEAHHVGTTGFWLAVIFMAFICILYTVVRIKHTDTMKKKERK